MAKKPLPCPTLLRLLLIYEPETGKLFWKERPLWMFSAGGKTTACHARRTWNKRFAGAEAFTADNGKGYRAGRLFGSSAKAHRTAWAITHGQWPTSEIDHVNRDKADNRLNNLRAVTTLVNSQNRSVFISNTSGVAGVAFYKRNAKWGAYINVDGKRVHLGLFAEKSDAVHARRDAEVKYGYHENHGRPV